MIDMSISKRAALRPSANGGRTREETMDFGIIFEIQTSNPFSNHREAAAWMEALSQGERADQVGFDAVWAVEHHFLVEYAHCSAPEVFLAALSQRTKRVRLGHGVVVAPPPVNHTFRIAERIAALDIISGGRVEAGFGRGFSDLEQHGFNMDPEHTRQMALEAVRCLPKIWAPGEFEGYKSEYLDLPPRTVIPKPLQDPHPPLWWACTSPPSFELAAQEGFGCLCFAFQPPEELGARIASYRQRCEETAASRSEAQRASVNEKVVGYTTALCLEDPSEARRLGAAGFLFNLRRWIDYIRPFAVLPSHEFYAKLLDNPLLEALDNVTSATSPSELEKIGGTLCELGYCALGDVDDCMSVVNRFKSLGVDQMLMLMQTAGIPDEKVQESIDLFGTSIIPKAR
jgi:alkanesulfonate monooxygenase SsuD/methylene tetrahydromethanopterin reductase-like flavin-dependent oxidoreductase (luciferase family)